MSLIDGERESDLAKCCANVSALRDCIIGILELRVRFASGERLTALASEMGIALATASKVINGHAWAHVDGPIKCRRRIK
jgi:hypothetical protein